MAKRPCFRPLDKFVGYKTVDTEFVWHPGLSRAQKQRNVVALHEAIQKADPTAKVLEISSKSLQPLGVSLSAFNLKMNLDGTTCSVESAFQAGKVFEGGVGPFPEMRGGDSREVRKSVQEQSAGRRLVGFELNGERWGIEPKTAFFCFLYLKALVDNPELGEALMAYDAFTDIEFNPQRQINCQAAAAAFYVSLRRQDKLAWAMASKENFLRACR